MLLDCVVHALKALCVAERFGFPCTMAPRHFFNDILFDTAVTSVVNPLQILERLFVQDVQREDEKNNPHRFSSLTGLHTLPWTDEAKKTYTQHFNDNADKIRKAFQSISSKVDPSKLSKDKTRPLQFMAPATLLENSIRCLLEFKDGDLNPNLSPEAVLQTLADVDMHAFWNQFKVTDVPVELTHDSVCAGDALGVWFQKQYLHVTHLSAPHLPNRSF